MYQNKNKKASVYRAQSIDHVKCHLNFFFFFLIYLNFNRKNFHKILTDLKNGEK